MENEESKPPTLSIHNFITKDKNHLSETIFQKQKLKISEILTQKQSNKTEDIKNKEISDNFENWEFSTFDGEFINNEYCPRYNSRFSKSSIKPNSKGIEMRGIIFRSIDFINYDKFFLETSINFSLKGESTLWIILRSDDKLDENSAIIKISKEDRTQKMFISFATYVYAENNQDLKFKIFTTQQLIDTSNPGDNIINVVIKVNENTYENGVKSMIFLPMMKRGRIMIAGTGQQINVKSLISKTTIKEKSHDIDNFLNNSAIFSNDKKQCDCCLIY